MGCLQTPEWKKVVYRYLNWVCLVIVSCPAGGLDAAAEPQLPPSASLQMPCLHGNLQRIFGACLRHLQLPEAAPLRANGLLSPHPPKKKPPLPAVPATQLAAAVVSVAVENEGSRGWTSFTLLVSFWHLEPAGAPVPAPASSHSASFPALAHPPHYACLQALSPLPANPLPTASTQLPSPSFPSPHHQSDH